MINFSCNKNVFYLILRSGLFYSATTLASTASIQAFLKVKQASDFQLGILAAIISITQIISMILMMKKVDSCKNPIRTISITTIGQAVLPATIIFICLIDPAKSIVIILVFLTSSLQYFFAGYRNMLDLKIYAYLITDTSIVQLIAFVGFVNGIAGIFTSILFTFCLRTFQPLLNYLFVFFFSLIFLLISGVINRNIELFQYTSFGINEPKERRNPFYKKLFWSFLLPNLLRGCGMAASLFLLSIGLLRFEGNGILVSLIVTATVIGGIFSSILCTILKNISPGKMVLAGSLLWSIGFLLIATVPSVTFYAISCFIVLFGQTFADMAVPAGVYQMIKKEEIGRFTATRLIVTLSSQSLFSLVFGMMLVRHHIILLCLGAAFSSVICGIVYCKIFLKDDSAYKIK